MNYGYLPLLIFLIIAIAFSYNNAPKVMALIGNMDSLEDIAVSGQTDDLLAYVFTNKKTSFLWMSTTGKPMSMFSGFNAQKARVIESWRTMADNENVTPGGGNFTYYPFKFQRTIDNVTEEVFVPDGEDGFVVEYSARSALNSLSFMPLLELDYRDNYNFTDNVLVLQSRATGRRQIAYVAIASNYPLTYDSRERKQVTNRYYFDEMRTENTQVIRRAVLCGGKLTASDIEPFTPIRFAIAVGDTLENVTSTARKLLSQKDNMLEGKAARIMSPINLANIHTDDERLTKALKLAIAAADALLVEEPYGKMIWAGIPWFNKPWGRDTFISLSGFTLVTGRFEEAKEILQKFSRFQRAQDGRIPNVIEDPSSPSYNTADGTPWFVKGCYDYYLYTGDRAFLENMFPVIERAIENTWKTYGDPSDGFISHAGKETWMDTSQDPRQGKAVEIQALWINELLDGSKIAEVLGNYPLAEKWRSMADVAIESFKEIFWNEASSFFYDYIDANGEMVDRIRPNAFVGLAAAGDANLASLERMERMVWTALEEELIALHGVRTIVPSDPLYVGVDSSTWDSPAYHNGDVWPWLSGSAIQVFADVGYIDESSSLLNALVDEILGKGDIGSITEIMDGDKDTPKGCWAQAWSVAEFLRAYYQVFLGVKPTLDGVKISPHPIANVENFSATSKIRGTTITTEYSSGQGYQRLTLNTDAPIEVVTSFTIPKGFDEVSVEVDGEKSTARVDENRKVEVPLTVEGRTTISVRYEAGRPYALVAVIIAGIALACAAFLRKFKIF